MYPWSFSFKKVQLARTINTPVNEWKYEYQLPSDRIGPPRAAFNSDQAGARPFTSWEIYGDKLLTNETATAMSIDGQGNTPQAIEDYSLIAVRY
jgi:hypothetical protein